MKYLLLVFFFFSLYFAAPNVAVDFSMTAKVHDQVGMRDFTLDVFYYYTKKNVSQISQVDFQYFLQSCVPYFHLIQFDYFNQVCYPVCLYGRLCQNKASCGPCNLEDPWMVLKKATQKGTCGGRVNTQYYTAVESSITYNFCLMGNTPLWFQTVSTAPLTNVTITIEEWDPTPPAPYNFYLPLDCTCSNSDTTKKMETPKLTTPKLSKLQRNLISNLFSVMNGKFD